MANSDHQTHNDDLVKETRLRISLPASTIVLSLGLVALIILLAWAY